MEETGGEGDWEEGRWKDEKTWERMRQTEGGTRSCWLGCRVPLSAQFLFVSQVAWSLHVVRIRDPASEVVRAVTDSPAGRTGGGNQKIKLNKRANASFG